jgi:hypothetical protein
MSVPFRNPARLATVALLTAAFLQACGSMQMEGATAPRLVEASPHLPPPCSLADGSPCTAKAALRLPARRIVLAKACRAVIRLTVDEATLNDDGWPCACHEVEDTPQGVRAGSWCGTPQVNEGWPAELSVAAERTVLRPGEGTRVTVRLRNPNASAASYRIPNRHMVAQFVDAKGNPLTDVFHSGRSPDEALVELAPGGVLDVSLDLVGTYARWQPAGAPSTMERRALLPGKYAIRVHLGGLGGAEHRLVPVEVNEGGF